MPTEERDFLSFHEELYKRDIEALLILKMLFSLIEEKPFGALAGDNWTRQQMVGQR